MSQAPDVMSFCHNKNEYPLACLTIQKVPIAAILDVFQAVTSGETFA